MKRVLHLLSITLSLSLLTIPDLLSQCNQNITTVPPNPGSLCAEDAPISCDPCYFDGFQGATIPGSNTCDVPGGFCGSIENNQWWAFMAPPSGTVTFNFDNINCTGTPNGSGIQAEIYSTGDCNNFTSVSNCWSVGAATPGSVSAVGLSPYCTYYLMVDGWAGDQCTFEISVSAADCQVPPPPAILEISGPSTGCIGATVTYCINSGVLPPSCGNNSNEINWTLSSNVGTIVGGNNQECVNITWTALSPNVILTASADNICFGPIGTDFQMIAVNPIPPTPVNLNVCLGECVLCAGQLICSPGTTPVLLQNYLGCDSLVMCNINPIQPEVNALGQVTICAPATFTICGTTFNTCGAVSGTCDNYQGCDSTVIADLAILNPQANIAQPGILACGPSATLTLNGGGSSLGSACAPTVATSYLWTGPAGGINGAANQATVTIDMPGQYCLTVTHSRNNVSCTDQECVTVIKDNAVPQTPQISGNNEPCTGETAQYTVTAVGSPAPTGFTWTTSNGTPIVGNGATVTVTWSQSGTFQVCATANNLCGSSSPACFTVNVQPAPTATLSGGGTVCTGSNAPVDLTITFSGNGPWNLIYAGPGGQQNLTVDISPHTLTVTQPGNYSLVSVSASSCPGTVSGTASVTNFPVPTAALSGTGSICQGSGTTANLSVNLTGTAPWSLVWAVNNGAQAPISVGASPFTLAVGEFQAGNISLVSVTDANGCVGTVSGSSTVTLNTAPTVSDISTPCDANNIFYQVTFTVNGGTGSYTVTPNNGAFTGNVFTTNNIFSGNGYSFTVTDANNCNPVIVAENIVVCDCETNAGDMGQSPIDECSDGPVNASYDLMDEQFDGNDIRIFVLHSGNGVNIVPPVIGNFANPTVSFNPATMQYGETYYLSAMLGDPDGSGGIDPFDPCLDVAQGTPITFYQPPTATLNGNPEICEGEVAEFIVNLTGESPWSISYDDGTQVQTLNGITSSLYTLVVNTNNSTTVCLTDVSDVNCSGAASGCSDVLVHTGVTATAQAVCDLTGTFFTVTITIGGGEPASYFVTPPDGTLTGNVFVSNPIPEGMGYSFVVDDNNGCDPQTVSQTLVDCDCLTDVGTMGTNAIELCSDGPATAVYNMMGQVTDPDDLQLFILHTNSGTSPGVVLATSASPSFSFNPATMDYGFTYFISAVVGNANGAGGIDLLEPCLAVAAGTPVTFYDVPTAALSGGASTCGAEEVELQIVLTGEQPWTVAINGDTLTGLTSPMVNHMVAPSATTTYTLFAFADANCPGTVSGSALVAINSAPTIINHNAACDPDTNTYSVTFSILGGDAGSYTVFPPDGTLSGNAFTSNSLTSNDPYLFVINDANNCGTDTVSGVLNCNCLTDAGTMSDVMKDACVNQGIAVSPASGLSPDPDDVVVYYLHTDPADPLGTMVATNNLAGFNFNATTMTAGVTYYISAVVGNNNGSGFPDSTDFCLDIAGPTPVLWNPLPTVNLVGSDAVCEGDTATVTISAFGTGPFNFQFTVNGTNQTASNVQSPYLYQFIPPATIGVTMIAVTDLGAGCSSPSTVSDTIFVAANVNAGTASDAFELCEEVNELLNLGDNLGGEDPGGDWTDATGDLLPGGIVNAFTLAPGTHQFTYTVNTTPPCLNDQEIVEVTIHPLPIADAGTDQGLDCDATAVPIGGSGTTPGETYEWSPAAEVTNADAATTEVENPGVYSLLVTTAFGCTDEDEVNVDQTLTEPAPHLTIAGVACFGDKNGSISVDSITDGEAPYLVSFNGGPFTGQFQFQNLEPGNYSLVITDAAGCEKEVTVLVGEPEEVNVELALELEGNENIINLGDSVTLVVIVTPPFDSLDQVIWTPADVIPCDTCQANVISPLQQTTFSIMVDENGCRDEDEITVYVKKSRPVYVPNAFSPNNDGTNDKIFIFADKSVVNIKSFLVFNRWGETVYQYYDFLPNDPAYGWDGELRGKPMNPAVFAWFAEVEFLDGRVILYEGDVTLMR